ncbi:MAG: TrkH family potassium uptake protein [Butyribacter sp.]|nr:TrkH family potassium uptake protein [bacterium]MDY3854014.1 TrkH family potassium uptake protein [Butyribacter sp.]
MNRSVIRYILGYVLKIESILLLPSCLVALIYHEQAGWYHLLTAILCGILGILLTLKKPQSFVFYLKEGSVATALSWIVMSLFGALPFWLSGEIPSFTNALFETISGFTTTGASILSDVEALSYCNLFWRSFTHWIGGMGVLVFLLAIVPLSGGSQINLMRAESPGPSVGKLVPKSKSTARLLYLIYLGMTIIEILFLLAGGMNLFESLTISFGTAGTGGFGIVNSSIGGYSPYVQWVVAIFMILFGVNFNAYYYIIYRKWKKALSMEEVRTYFIIIILAVGIIFLNIVNTTNSALDALRHASFQVATLITSTGYSTVDFNLWSQTAKTVLVLLMFVGACAGSTGGGIKVSRIIILVKTIKKELTSYIHPKSIQKIKIDGKPVEHDVVRATNVYFVTFMIVFAVSVFVISFDGKDLVTNFTAVLATINNMGPGLEGVGPTQNFGAFSGISKYVLMFDMIAGRLELFPLLILFHPAIWKELFTRHKITAKGK